MHARAHHSCRGKVSGKHNVDSTAGGNNFLSIWALVELPDRICEGASSVDYTLEMVNWVLLNEGSYSPWL